jgi:hypothetical protein
MKFTVSHLRDSDDLELLEVAMPGDFDTISDPPAADAAAADR